jgi:hypothetical protein
MIRALLLCSLPQQSPTVYSLLINLPTPMGWKAQSTCLPWESNPALLYGERSRRPLNRLSQPDKLKSRNLNNTAVLSVPWHFNQVSTDTKQKWHKSSRTYLRKLGAIQDFTKLIHGIANTTKNAILS